MARVAVMATIAVAFALAVPVALASGTYNLNGKWTLTVLTCKHKHFTFPAKTVVSKWSAKSGKFNWTLKVGKAGIHGTAVESGSTITVTSSNDPKLVGHKGTVSQSGSKLTATFPAPCTTGGVGVGTFTKKATPPPKKHKKTHHKGKHKHHKK